MLPHNPKCFFTLHTIAALWAESNFFMEIHVMSQDEHLLDMSNAIPHFIEDPLDQITDDEKHVAVEAGNRIVKDHDAVCCHARLGFTALEQMVEIQKRNERLFALA